jgi:hypothetical protein
MLSEIVSRLDMLINQQKLKKIQMFTVLVLFFFYWKGHEITHAFAQRKLDLLKG